MSLYNLRSTATILYSITKFTPDLEVEATYSVGRTACDCPAGARASCRHRQMLPTLIERVDTAWFYCFETKTWEDPTGEATIEEGAEEIPSEPSDPVEADERFTNPTNITATEIDERIVEQASTRSMLNAAPPPQALANPTSLEARPKEASQFRRRI